MKRRNEEDEIYNKRMPQKIDSVLQIIINSAWGMGCAECTQIKLH